MLASLVLFLIKKYSLFMIQEKLKKLVEFKTLSLDQDENKRALNWIKKEISQLSLFIKEFEKNGFYSLVITTKETKHPKVLLAAHIDVVSGEDSLFNMKIRDEKIYGRGVFDMKYAIACYLELLEELSDNLNLLDFGIMITTDEEMGGFSGTNYLLNEIGYGADICILPDGGQNWQLITKAKGVIQLKIDSCGKSAHGSKPWLGISAINNLMEFLSQLSEDEIFSEDRYDKGDLHYYNTMNIGKIDGGSAINKVAEKAMAILDIRFVPDESEEKIIERIKGRANNFSDIEIETVFTGSVLNVDSDNPFIRSFRDIASEVRGKDMKEALTHGSSDARFFSENNIPVIVIRPEGGGHHGDEEWISSKDLNDFYETLRMFVFKNAKDLK